MDKRTFDRDFIERIAQNLECFTQSGSLDKPAISLQYNIETDQMQKSGEITETQRLNWCTPKGALNLSYLKRVKNSL